MRNEEESVNMCTENLRLKLTDEERTPCATTHDDQYVSTCQDTHPVANARSTRSLAGLDC